VESCGKNICTQVAKLTKTIYIFSSKERVFFIKDELKDLDLFSQKKGNKFGITMQSTSVLNKTTNSFLTFASNGAEYSFQGRRKGMPDWNGQFHRIRTLMIRMNNWYTNE
jgi:hypothetical protein